MMISSLFEGYRYIYKQPKLPWYKRLIGMQYGPGWHIEVLCPDGLLLRSYDQEVGPNPALVMQVMAETVSNGEP